MKINFTKKQFENLLKLCYIGNWMANAQRNGTKDEPMVAKYEEIWEHLESLAPEFGLDSLVVFDKKLGRYFVTGDFENAADVHGLIDEYDETSFWDDLIEYLADRDFAKTYDKKERQKMDTIKFFEKREPFEKKWSKEIYEHGLERLEIKDDK